MFDDESFDVVFCQQALQYIPNRAAAVSEMCRVLRPGGEAITAVWRGLDHNPIQRTIRDCLSRHLSPQAGSLFDTAFSSDLDDPDRWTALFGEAGFGDVAVEHCELVVVADDARERMTGPLGGTPIAAQLQAMDPDAYEAMVADMLTAMTPYIVEGRLEAPTTVNLIIADK